MIAHHREFVDRSMSTSMTPYREPGTIVVHEKLPVKKTGLIPALPPHECSLPKNYGKIEFVKTKFLFFFTRMKKVTKEAPILEGSLFRCPDCFKVYLYESPSYGGGYTRSSWIRNKKAADAWFEKTGEFVDGEP